MAASGDMAEDDETAGPPPGATGEAAVAAAVADAEARGSRAAGDDSGSLNLRCARLPKNDIGNARRLIERFGEDLLFVQDIGWHVWTGKLWNAERGEMEAQLRAHQVSQLVKDEAEALEEDGPWGGESEKAFAERLERHHKWAIASGNSARVHALLREAVPYLAVPPEALDRDQLAFNVENGTLRLVKDVRREKDLECPDPEVDRWIEVVTGRVRRDPHRRGDRIAKIAPVKYRPKAACPQFEAFLARILPDEAVRGFLQRYFGYAITGDTSEQCLVLLHGEGANGKSTLIDVITWIMGDYATSLPFASLLHDDKRRGSEATPDIARLPGARLVSASEPEIGQRFSESLLKSLTGGDVMTVRHLNKGFFEFLPTFKLVLSFNHRPNVRGQDEGIWRRLLLVPFEVKIPKDERDRFLKDKLKGEASGILNWLLEGARLWLEEGLAVPDQVRAATDAYRSESDPVGQFLATATWHEAGSTVQASKLYKAYTSWCHDSAVTPLSQTAFGKTLGDRGYRKSRMGTYFYQDLRLDDRYQSTVDAAVGGGGDAAAYGGPEEGFGEPL